MTMKINVHDLRKLVSEQLGEEELALEPKDAGSGNWRDDRIAELEALLQAAHGEISELEGKIKQMQHAAVSRAPAGAATGVPGAPRAQRPMKQQYRIYGRKGANVAHTRIHGQAYGAPPNTRFKSGEEASLEKGVDGKIHVRSGDRDQVWDPIDG
jgi:hypothetical protein